MRLSPSVRLALRVLVGAGVAASASCSSGATSSDASASPDAAVSQSTDGATTDLSLPGSGASDLSSGAAGDLATPPCITRVTYGATWLHPQNHPDDYDDAAGLVGWDGTCTDDGASSFAVLTNGWKPYFSGHGCTIALDYSGCANAPTDCASRVTYGAAWLRPQAHPAQFDDVAGRLYSDDTCHAAGNQSYSVLANGWTPYFNGAGACELSFRYLQCGGLYENPVVPVDCPDPGVLRDGNRYVMVCTSGDAADAFPIRVSTDLVHWTSVGHIFPANAKPVWARSDFWAPEIHQVGGRYVAYFTARDQDGQLSVGAATANAPTGPFTDLGAPLLHDPNIGLIDPTQFQDQQGNPYLVWKEDGNAVGKPTPIHGQRLATDGLTLQGSPATLITNDQAWEGALVEGPWVVSHGGSYFLFYSANGYATTRYAVGVAQAGSPLGPYTKGNGPVLVSDSAWSGPGHCSVVDTPAGDWYMVYHAWHAGHVGGPGDARVTLVDEVWWSGGPTVPAAPSFGSRPLP